MYYFFLKFYLFNSNNDIEEPDEESQTIKGYKVINDTDTRIIGDFLDNGTTLNGYPVYTFNTYSLECNNNPGGDVMPAWRVADSNGTVIYFGQGLTPDTVSWYSLPMSDYSLTVPKFETIY